MLFGGFLAWTGEVLQSRGVPAAGLGVPLRRFQTLLYDFPRTVGILDAALAAG